MSEFDHLLADTPSVYVRLELLKRMARKGKQRAHR